MVRAMLYHHQRMRIWICITLDILMFIAVNYRNILMRHIHLKLGKKRTSMLMRLRHFKQGKKGIAMDVFSNDDMESYCEHVLLHMYDFWTNWRSDLKRYNITKLKRTLRLQKEEWYWLITEIYSKDPHKVSKKQVPEILLIERTIRKRGSIEQKSKLYRQVARELVAQKVFKSKSRDSVVGYGGVVKAKNIRGPSRTRVELEVELNATRKKLKFMLIV
ncbi:hypothetical protein Cgig2_012933 [Carnegiea gigantea]|uniref:Uncharacterized protein n=1 Tax=Carnegiea gigantea TaxID=171969 RepID=A0A9Q1JJ79_9CARY|nr:hypothetical protein Cgig2_012933 [Carnegiea gigantea]